MLESLSKQLLHASDAARYFLKLASDEAEKALRGEEYTVLLDYSGDSELIKTADLTGNGRSLI